MATEICPICNKSIWFPTRYRHSDGVITHYACHWGYAPRNLNKTQNSEFSESAAEREVSTITETGTPATPEYKELPAVVMIFLVLIFLSMVGGSICAIFLMQQSVMLAVIWFLAGLIQAAFFAAIASGLNYLSEIAANTKVLADARLEAVQSKNSDTSV